MSKNKNTNSGDLVLTDLDTGVTLSVPSANVTTHDNYSHMDNSYTITSDITGDSNIYISTDTVAFTDDEFNAMYDRPNDKIIKKRYAGHKKVQDISEVGMHTLEQMSKRGR